MVKRHFALNRGEAPNYTPFEKVLLAAYEGLLITKPLIWEREIKLCMPIPILKPILTGKLLPLMVAQETAVQQWALYILYQVTSDGINRENKWSESVEQTGMPIEYSHLPSSPINDALPWEGETKEVWFTVPRELGEKQSASKW